MEPWLSAADVGALVGVSPKTVRKWARRRLLPGRQFGGRVWKFRASEVAAAFEQAPELRRSSTDATARGRRLAVGSAGPGGSGVDWATYDLDAEVRRRMSGAGDQP